MVNSWQDLENLAVEILVDDHPVKPKGSGNAKKEEDVIGDNIIAQCKYTEDKNFSILTKDLERLKEACKLQNKLPLFISSNSKETLLSLPITNLNENLIKVIITILRIYASLDKLEDEVKIAKTIEQLRAISKKITRNKSAMQSNANEINSRLFRLLDMAEIKYVDLTTYDLFEGEKNGIK